MFSRASQGHAHHSSPSSASPQPWEAPALPRIPELHLPPRAAFLGLFSKDEASGTFSMVGNPAGNSPAPGGSSGGWKDLCGGCSTLKIPVAAPGLVLAVVVQLSSAPCAPLDYFPPRFPRAQSEINSCLGSCPITINPGITTASKDIWRAVTPHNSEPPDGTEIRIPPLESSQGYPISLPVLCLLSEEQLLTQRIRVAALGCES